MSYICMVANKNGIAVSGDSRLTFQPMQLNLHLDNAQKVFSCPEQKMVWACCGMMVWAGVNYYKVISWILRQENRSLHSRLNQIGGMVGRATAAQHRLSQKGSVFTLLVGAMKEKGPVVYCLDAVNGEVQLRQMEAPVLIQSGWVRSLHQPKPQVEAYENESVEQLVSRVRERCLWAMRKDGRLALEEAKHIQTIGGNIRVAFLKAEKPEE